MKLTLVGAVLIGALIIISVLLVSYFCTEQNRANPPKV